MRGSTRAWSAELGSKERQRMGDMVSQLDYNSREMELQRIEIKRLREQMQNLMTRQEDSGDESGGERRTPSALGAPVVIPTGQSQSTLPYVRCEFVHVLTSDTEDCHLCNVSCALLDLIQYNVIVCS